MLLLRYPESLAEGERREWLEFALKFQQVTGPVTAKALEDTAYYVYLRLASLNEVGGEPDHFGTSVEAFHRLNASRLERWPGSLAATSTHDTKRSEDVRVRIAALSEAPREWRAHLARWSRLNRRFRTEVDFEASPDRNDELLLYQTLVGTLPEPVPKPGTDGWRAYAGRVVPYLEKAVREAKIHTSWTNVDKEYEGATARFAEGVLASSEFLESFVPLARRIAAAGRVSSLAQVALKLASPGPCDVYQGCELWDLSLVDPDNRRPVDFELRARLLEELEARLGAGGEARAALARELASPDGLRDGRAKLLLLRAGLVKRRALPELFLRGSYLPLKVEGAMADRVVAFARVHEGRVLLCAVPRLPLGILDAAAARGSEPGWEGELALPKELPSSYEGSRHRGEPLGPRPSPGRALLRLPGGPAPLRGEQRQRPGSAAREPRSAGGPEMSASRIAYLVRHGVAEPHGAAPEPVRKLTAEGRREFEALARRLASRLHLSRIVTSPYLRASQTAELLAAATGAPLEKEERLAADHSSGEEVLSMLVARGAGVALVGHDDELSEALSLAAGRRMEMKKGAVAAIELWDGGHRVLWMEAP